MALWTFKQWFKNKLFGIKDLDFKVKNRAELLRIECVAEILQKLKSRVRKIERIGLKLKVKDIKHRVQRFYRDQYGNEVELNEPLFTQNEIETIKKVNRNYLLVISLFIIAETALYYLTAQLFVPADMIILKLLVALFFGLIFMYCLDLGLEKHFEYKDALESFEKGNINKTTLKKFRDKKYFGYFLIVITFVAIIAAGIIRSLYLEQFDTTGLSESEIARQKLVNQFASVLTITATLATALLMAYVKQQRVEISVKHRMYKNWRKNNKERNEYLEELTQLISELKTKVYESVNKYWNLILELALIYKSDYDKKNEDLYKEYQQLKANNNLTINEKTYQKFKDIQSVDKQLFEYGIYNDTNLRDILIKVAQIEQDPVEYFKKLDLKINDEDESNDK